MASAVCYLDSFAWFDPFRNTTPGRGRRLNNGAEDNWPDRAIELAARLAAWLHDRHSAASKTPKAQQTRKGKSCRASCVPESLTERCVTLGSRPFSPRSQNQTALELRLISLPRQHQLFEIARIEFKRAPAN